MGKELVKVSVKSFTRDHVRSYNKSVSGTKHFFWVQTHCWHYRGIINMKEKEKFSFLYLKVESAASNACYMLHVPISFNVPHTEKLIPGWFPIFLAFSICEFLHTTLLDVFNTRVFKYHILCWLLQYVSFYVPHCIELAAIWFPPVLVFRPQDVQDDSPAPE